MKRFAVFIFDQKATKKASRLTFVEDLQELKDAQAAARDAKEPGQIHLIIDVEDVRLIEIQ